MEDPFDAPSTADDQRISSAFQIQKNRSQSLSTFPKDTSMSQGFRFTQPEKDEVKFLFKLRSLYRNNLSPSF